MIYGYARISDKSQQDSSQIDALEKYGCDRIIYHKINVVSLFEKGWNQTQ